MKTLIFDWRDGMAVRQLFIREDEDGVEVCIMVSGGGLVRKLIMVLTPDQVAALRTWINAKVRHDAKQTAAQEKLPL